MSIKLGSAVFEDHISIELIPGKWTDTFVFPVRYDRMLSPWSSAEVVKSVIRSLKKLRKSPSLWVPVNAPGRWYFDEIKYALRKASIPVAVTQDQQLPGLLSFSKHPGIYNTPCHGGLPADPLPTTGLTENAIKSLLQMTCLTSAYNNEIACGLMVDERTSRKALKQLAASGYVEFHPNDGNIDCHLVDAKARIAVKGRKSTKWNGDHWPYWRIKRRGVTAALRVWGVPAGGRFDYHREKNRLLNSLHRRRSRQWPKWVSLALPHARIYAGWNEVTIPGLDVRPDALAWGTLQNAETLFWLEVESGSGSGRRIEDLNGIRWEKATGYAQATGMRLVFVLLGQPWVREVARLAFSDVPPTCAAIIASWNKFNFGKLPFPKWGEVVVE